MTHTNVASFPSKVDSTSVEAIRQMLSKKGYQDASIDAFMPKLTELLSHESLKDKKPDHLVSYVETLLKNAAKADKKGVISLHFSAKDVPLEALDVSKIISMATPPPPNPVHIAKTEQNIQDLRARASERGSYAEQLANKASKPHPPVRTTQDKVVIGLNAIAGALFIADGIRRFVNGERTVDENGKTSIALGAMVVPALQLLLGVGCAYMAHAHYSATSVKAIPVTR